MLLLPMLTALTLFHSGARSQAERAFPFRKETLSAKRCIPEGPAP
jgi:hypothetical protein